MQRSILIVTNRPPWPLQDGGALAMHQLIAGYKREGWVVHLLTMNTSRHWVAEAEILAAYTSIDSVTVIPFDNRLEPARVVRNLLFSRQPEHAGRFYSVDFEEKLVETVQRLAPDIVQMESLFLTGYLPAIQAVCGAALVLRMHNVEQEIWSRAASRAQGARRYYLHSLARRMERYEKWVWAQYHLLLPITSNDAEKVRDKGCATPLHLTPFGISVQDVAQKSVQTTSGTRHKFYHLGAMDWLPNREGVAWFIRDVWPHLLAHQSSAEFHFGGRLLEDDFAAPLPYNVFNHGAVKDARSFTDSMDTLVVPLRAGGGIRVKILDAMAAGKLVISTAVGIQGIAAVPGRHFLQADTPREFSQAVQWLVERPEQKQEMIAAAKALVAEMYDAEKITARLSQRLQILLQERH